MKFAGGFCPGFVCVFFYFIFYFFSFYSIPFRGNSLGLFGRKLSETADE